MPRAQNGPEDAQDYLWLTQDLWMQSDVWEWADQDPDTKNTVRRLCSRGACQKVETEVAEFKRCAACKTVIFSHSSRAQLLTSLRSITAPLNARKWIGRRISQVRFLQLL